MDARSLIYRILKSADVRNAGTVADAILDVLASEGYEVRRTGHLRSVRPGR